MTGWAQVNGLRGETPTVDKMHRRVQYDLDYLKNWSLSLDLKILARTVLTVANDHNSYKRCLTTSQGYGSRVVAAAGTDESLEKPNASLCEH